MTAYVALLRGINVGGHHRVPMADLREAFATLGASDVSTYIQSGNVVFTSAASEGELAASLAPALADRFGFPIPVVVRTAAELAAVARAHPLAHLTSEEKLLHVVFLEAKPTAEAIASFDVGAYAPDDLVVEGRAAYVAYPAGSARSKLTLDLLERALGTAGTGRNWRTVQKLLELTNALA